MAMPMGILWPWRSRTAPCKSGIEEARELAASTASRATLESGALSESRREVVASQPLRPVTQPSTVVWRTCRH